MSFITPSNSLFTPSVNNIVQVLTPVATPVTIPAIVSVTPSIASSSPSKSQNIVNIPVIASTLGPSVSYSNITCPNVSKTLFTFTIIPSDLGVSTLDNFWTEISTNLNIQKTLPTGYTFAPYGASITLPMSLSPSSNNEMWLFVASLLSIFQFNLGRICDVSMNPSSLSNIQSIQVMCAITDQPSKNYPNDNLTSQCLVLWISQFLKSFDPLNPNNFSQSPPANVLSNPMCTGSNFSAKVVGKINEKFSDVLHLSKLNIKFKNINIINDEKYTNIGIVSSSSATPSNILDYVFMFAYPVSFLGAIFFAIMQYMSIRPVTIIGNDQAVIALNAYIAICGFLSFIYWFQVYNFSFMTKFINDASVVYNLETIKPTSSS